MWGNSTLKSVEKKIFRKEKYWKKLLIKEVNTDTVNWEKLFDRSADSK